MKRLLERLEAGNCDSYRNVTATSRTPAQEARATLGLLLVVGLLPSLAGRFVAPAPVWFAPVALAMALVGVGLTWVSLRPDRRAGPSAVAVSARCVSFWRGMRSEHLPWAEIEAIQVEPDGARLRTVRGVREIPGHLHRWRSVAAAIEARLAPANEPARPALGAAVIEQWLGAPEVVGRCTSPWFGFGLGSWCLLMLVVALAATILRAGPVGWPKAWQVLWVFAKQCLLIGAALTPLALGTKVKADATGFRRRIFGRAGHSCGWGDVVGVERARSSWTILTAEGPVLLWAGDPNAVRIVETAQHVLDARAQGQMLPRLAGVSDAALSQAEPSVEADRGLSGSAGPA